MIARILVRLLLTLIVLGVASIPDNLGVRIRGGVAAAAVAPAKKRISFSFDDLPRGAGAFLTPDERTTKLIAALKEAGVQQVAFYVNPGRITGAGDRDLRHVEEYVAAGHVIGDHTFSHMHLTTTSADNFLADIDKSQAWLKGRPGYRPWFRFPFLDEGGPNKEKRDAVRAGLKARGLRNAYTTIDGLDWNMDGQAIAAKKAGKPIDMAALRDLYVETMVQSADFSDDLMTRAIGRPAPHVLLLHETDIAALFIGDLVKALRADGWEIVTADQTYADPVYLSQPDIAWTAGTLDEQLAWVKRLSAPRWYDRNDIKVANALFAQRVLHEAPGDLSPLHVGKKR